MSASAFQFFVGIDWATEAHQICLLDTQGEIVHERTVVHSGSAVGEFLNQLLELTGCPPASIAVAIEVPRGALVETLLERGFSAFFLNPKQLDRFRDRHFPAGAKDDCRDAFVLACSLRTDPHCFHAIEVDDPLVMRLRDLTRLDDELRSSFNRNSCQLREQLYRYYPQLLRLSPAANEAWLWALLELAPSPAKARRLKPARIEKLLRAHRIRRLQSADIVNELRAPGFQLAAGTADAASEHALLLIPHLRLIAQQRTELARRLQTLLEQLASPSEDDEDPHQHRDVEIILSLPGVGRVVAATMLAEASQALAHRDYPALRAYCGSAPITRRSGKKIAVLMRRGCNDRLRNALYHWARVSIQHDPHSRHHYHQLRSRGHSHGRALRGLADRLLAVLCAMLPSSAAGPSGSLNYRAGQPLWKGTALPQHLTNGGESPPSNPGAKTMRHSGAPETRSSFRPAHCFQPTSSGSANRTARRRENRPQGGGVRPCCGGAKLDRPASIS